MCASELCNRAYPLPSYHRAPSKPTFVAYDRHHVLYAHVRVILPCYHR
jgi:hypothetical protein